ncbi:hypothetical protein CR513_40556, partial [Mucuna pruriens]
MQRTIDYMPLKNYRPIDPDHAKLNRGRKERKDLKAPQMILSRVHGIIFMPYFVDQSYHIESDSQFSTYVKCDKSSSMEEEHQYSGSGEEQHTQEPDREDQQLQHGCQLPGAEDKLVLQFMDSLHNYLSLFDEVSSTLRQGWFDLASARHSMGASRINSSLLDLNFHSAATTLKITNYDGTQPRFMLRKWVSSEHESTQLEDENEQPQDSSSVKSSGMVQKERSKSLSVFGVLISPKLRASQLSFERALETLIEIANMKSSLLYSFHQLQKAAGNASQVDNLFAVLGIHHSMILVFNLLMYQKTIGYSYMIIVRGGRVLPNACKQFWHAEGSGATLLFHVVDSKSIQRIWVPSWLNE